ncbi:uncharacterized protein LOC134269162 [Saccostrea cucullata]|uniref:uncharacterized protein LOC134269162 n=1 Tax=Saccostrea cuccullata TaxID=36930 RepID=UPI002ED14136
MAINDRNHAGGTCLVGAILFSTGVSFLHEAITVFMNIQEFKLQNRRHKVPVHLGLSVAHVILTFLRLVLVLAVLSGNIWVWISIGVGVGTGYFFMRPCLVCKTREAPVDYDVTIGGRVRLQTVRKLGHYSVQKLTQQSKVTQEKQDVYFRQTTEHNNNTHDTDKQTQPLLNTASQSTERSNLSPQESMTFLPSAQPTIQNMSNEERWDYIRETFQKLSRSHLYEGLERRRQQQDRSYVPCESPLNSSQPRWESSFDASTVDIQDLLNEEEMTRAQNPVKH